MISQNHPTIIAALLQPVLGMSSNKALDQVNRRGAGAAGVLQSPLFLAACVSLLFQAVAVVKHYLHVAHMQFCSHYSVGSP
jgi:hypothetical protein